MSQQSKSTNYSEKEKEILDLEKKYFGIILKILKSKDFSNDLQLIEKEISDNYTKFDRLWDLKNKVKVPAERVVRHHLYMEMQKRKLIKGIFPSPLSSDFGVRTEDAVVCVDIKTIDKHNNSGDLRAVAVEKNQTSFNNKNYPYIEIPHNMNEFDDYSRMPVLTYVVRIVYDDDKARFTLCRDKKWHTVALACIPNGKLSRLFGYNIVENCKTYDYFNPKTDGEQYEPILYPKNNTDADKIVKNECLKRGLEPITIDKKTVYYDPKTRVTWWKTSVDNQRCIRPVKGGSSVRFNTDSLKYRYDSNNNPWYGYDEWIIEQNFLLKGQMDYNKEL